jgi:3-methylfumaryl-CoA hydratase
MTDIPREAAAAIGKVVAADVVVALAAVEAMAAALGRSGPALKAGDALPPLWHGMFCIAKLPPARLGDDGLSRDEPILPALPGYPAKLFAGARFRFLRPLAIGGRIRKESSITGFEVKSGRSGTLLFAKIEHRLIGAEGLAAVEENDIIYRAAETGVPTAGGQPAPGGGRPQEVPAPAWRRSVDPDPVLLFRHSAVTFNSHRIHYDREFTRGLGHPGLIVPGMLIARLMLEVVHDERPAAVVSGFSFRAGRILYDTAPFVIEGRPAADGRTAELRAVAADGGAALTATAEFAV